tara:strand:+ start:713 stop:2992 length:2280 start_codon:yes stop_codon:yes gene_type:complete
MNLSYKNLTELVNNFSKDEFDKISSNDQLITKLSKFCHENKLDISNSSLLTTFNSYKLNYNSFKENELEAFFYILFGAPEAKAKLAYKKLNSVKSNKSIVDKLKSILKIMGNNDSSINNLVIELSEDGSKEFNEDKFVNFLPKDFNSHPKAYKAMHKDVIKEIPLNYNDGLKVSQKDIASLKVKEGGTSPLQVQIGFFRLLQGAAYRSFRESFSANCETHLRAYDLPYSIKDFVRFVSTFIDYYLSLGIVKKEVYSVFYELKESVFNLEKDLNIRMENWETIPKTENMLKAEKNLEEEYSELEHHHQLFSVLIELVLSASLHGHDPENIIIEDLEHHELNRLRHLEIYSEVSNSEKNRPSINSEKKSFKDSWQRVIVDSTNTFYKGAIIPTSYWYEEFMPLLLKATSVIDQNDLTNWEITSLEDLDGWFKNSLDQKEFDRYGNDIKESFLNLSLNKKKLIKQAWLISRHYLNGVQKRRERLEFGRESGYLSQYVAFIDCDLGRDDIEKSQMRLSFPYFIGPSTWRLLHTSAEIIKKQGPENETNSIEKFKLFFNSLATMYPCPYCRYHLNKFVVKNKEVAMYPVEYLLLGTEDKFNFNINIQDKLNSIIDGKTLSLFLWKLHNTVSSSIARSEDWFHLDTTSYYTSRYWPSLDSELERAHLLNVFSISTKLISKIYGIIRNAIRLSTLKDELILYIETNQDLKRIFYNSLEASKELDDAIIISEYLEDHYKFNPSLTDDDPHFSAAEESLARSGKFSDD